MGEFLSREELAATRPAETLAFSPPVPSRVISNGEFGPAPQTVQQKSYEARLKALADTLGRRQGLSRRRFLRTASGMAAAFVALNEVHGPIFAASPAEAAMPDLAVERAGAFAHQFVFDDQVHFLKDDSKLAYMVDLREFAAKVLNPAMGDPGTLDSLKFENFVKEVYLDSDTKVALLSSAPADNHANWLIDNDQMAAARRTINEAAGSRRMLCHALFTPGHPGWMEELDRAIEQLKPDGWKGYTIGDPRGPSKFRWRLDDEKAVYPAFEKLAKAGIANVCIHKGLLPPNAEKRYPGVSRFADVSDVAKAAKDWPQLNFVIYHAGFRGAPLVTPQDLALFEEQGRIDWVSDLAAIPGEAGVGNVYADIGTTFAVTCTTYPRLAAGLLGILVKGLGADRILWGTDSVWYGSPQWQIEALRRIEVPEELQQKFGWAALGEPDGPVKKGILGLNGAKLYRIEVKAAGDPLPSHDRFARLKSEYRAAGGGRSNLAYGYVV